MINVKLIVTSRLTLETHFLCVSKYLWACACVYEVHVCVQVKGFKSPCRSQSALSVFCVWIRIKLWAAAQVHARLLPHPPMPSSMLIISTPSELWAPSKLDSLRCPGLVFLHDRLVLGVGLALSAPLPLFPLPSGLSLNFSYLWA